MILVNKLNKFILKLKEFISFNSKVLIINRTSFNSVVRRLQKGTFSVGVTQEEDTGCFI